MPYVFDTTEQRRKIMKKIKNKSTKAEALLAKALWSTGVRYRRNFSKLPGKPDIALTKFKIAVFVDGEFWHGYDWENKKNKIVSNRGYWIPKIEKNIQRDLDNNAKLVNLGWTVIRFWEKEITKDLSGCVLRIIKHCQE